jgi:hypothetical protein
VVKAPISQALDKGLQGEAPQGTQQLQNSPVGKAITQIFDDGITDGARSAAAVASVFVLLGALSSLLIPNARAHAWEGERREAAVPEM